MFGLSPLYSRTLSTSLPLPEYSTLATGQEYVVERDGQAVVVGTLAR